MVSLTLKLIDKISEFDTVPEVVKYLESLLTSVPTFKTHKPFQGDNGDWFVIPINVYYSEVETFEKQSSDTGKKLMEQSWEKLDCFDRFYSDHQPPINV